MANISITNGGLQAGPDAVDNTVVFDGQWNVDENGMMEILIQIVSITGTGIQFSLRAAGNTAVNTDAWAMPANAKQVITLNTRTQVLIFKCSNAADSFTLSS